MAFKKCGVKKVKKSLSLILTLIANTYFFGCTSGINIKRFSRQNNSY